MGGRTQACETGNPGKRLTQEMADRNNENSEGSLIAFKTSYCTYI